MSCRQTTCEEHHSSINLIDGKDNSGDKTGYGFRTKTERISKTSILKRLQNVEVKETEENWWEHFLSEHPKNGKVEQI